MPASRGGFDRIKPPGAGHDRRPPSAGGREALFTGAPAAAGRRAGDRRAGVTAECSRCGSATALDAATAVAAAVPLVLLAPWRTHPVFARCPACGRRSWLRLSRGGAPPR